MPIHKIFFFLLFFAIIFILYQALNIIYLTYTYPSNESQKSPVHVLIISSWRSGSSFLGQIFNHHEDVFYLFEPGHSVWMKFRKQSVELLNYLVRDLFHSLFTCDVSPLRQYLSKGGKSISEMGFFAESRALCSPPSCSFYVPSEGFDRLKCYSRCRNVSLDKMAEACTKYSHVVMKTVRILDLSVLLPLFRDPNLDLRIVHLVRDPRAVASSRKYFSLSIEDRIVLQNNNEKSKNDKVMSKICRSQVAINKFAKTAKHFMHGRYMLLRHEDLALHPVKNLKEIYEFANLRMLEDMESWIYNVTHKEVLTKRGFMTFSKNSSSVVQKWRWKMDFKKVKGVEQVCKEAMDLFGYLPVNSELDMKNVSVELVI
ncbi:carbohydrate sulfotransferase 4-like [Hyperolius riggenbachi]|uniref:carbohydrate sulfotransferase 4-like n=1 Tax=Hyperolius riggenbachi TaxID=752182 RepID=UPI0035A36A28